MKIVIYTAITNGYDSLQEPEFVNSYDHICFSDIPIESDTWTVKPLLPIYEDTTRLARRCKILYDEFVGQYDISIWVDGNFVIRNDVTKLIEEYLTDSDMACYDHMQCYDKRDCIYQEVQTILSLGSINKSWKDDPNLILKQNEKYIKDGYPWHNGLISSGILIRKHTSKVNEVMNSWWNEISYGSKRDQLSFNYVAWKHGFKFNYIQGDIRNNSYFLHTGAHCESSNVTISD